MKPRKLLNELIKKQREAEIEMLVAGSDIKVLAAKVREYKKLIAELEKDIKSIDDMEYIESMKNTLGNGE